MGVDVSYQPLPTEEPTSSNNIPAVAQPPVAAPQEEVTVIIGTTQKNSFCDKLKLFRFKLAITCIVLIQVLPIFYACQWILFIAPAIGIVSMFTRCKFIAVLHFISSLVYFGLFAWNFVATVYFLATYDKAYTGSGIMILLTSGGCFVIFAYLLRVYVRYLIYLRQESKKEKEAKKEEDEECQIHIQPSQPQQPVSINSVDTDMYPGNVQHVQPPQQQYVPFFYPQNFAPNNNNNNQQPQQFMIPQGYYLAPIPQQQQQRPTQL